MSAHVEQVDIELPETEQHNAGGEIAVTDRGYDSARKAPVERATTKPTNKPKVRHPWPGNLQNKLRNSQAPATVKKDTSPKKAHPF